MAIRIKHGEVIYIADTPEEAARLGQLLGQLIPGVVESLTASAELQTEWTPELFQQFVERLGDTQKKILTILVEREYVSDEYLREELNIDNNQALAGALSGISKQAAALNISARSVFTFQNVRKTGKRQSFYHVAPIFRQMAAEMGWSTRSSA